MYPPNRDVVGHVESLVEGAEEDIYFLPPPTASETAWPALARPCWADSSMEPPSFWAESPPERAESPTFWVVDFWPSVTRLAWSWRREGGGLTRLDSRGGLVTKSRHGLACLLGGRLLRVWGH